MMNPSRFAASVPVGGWVELGRTTLGSAGDAITVSSLADKRYYMVLGYTPASGQIQQRIRGGNSTKDTGSNYAMRESRNGAADAAAGSEIGIRLSDGETTPEFSVSYVANLSASEKLTQSHMVIQNTAGAGTAPKREECVGKHAFTSNPWDVISLDNPSGSGDFDTGSEVVVLGWDPADTHTTNFWEELASVDLSGGAATSLTSNAFTSKKYLWIQCYVDMTTTQTPAFRVGKTTLDTGSNYSTRYSLSGAADGTLTSQTLIHAGINTQGHFFNFFMVNNAANEKLIIQHAVNVETVGAGTAPKRAERVSKWADTSNQIDIIGLINSGSGNFGTNTIMKVWGSD
jgi:hypothetical protein